ncbi:hypothetical protein R8Z50_11720 [Longispora sp. K20-0274]|uniref:hypothetical protein n=1 Tax=Longispora sp. K20-0274 TaxID=3088255 RepID=UPI00399BC2D5
MAQHLAAAHRLPAQALGLPELPVLPAPEYLVEEAAGPLAPIPDTWWKEAGGRRAAATGRPMVWTDDDLRDHLGLRGAVTSRPLWPDLPVPTPAISPPRRVGLTPRHLRLIGAFLSLPASA